MELQVHVPTRLIAVTLCAAFALAVLAPGSARADRKKQLFEQGAKHYQAEEFAEAAAAFEELYSLEPTTEVLFAWAQAERFSDNCEKAVELFGKLLSSDMSERNKKAVRDSKAKCEERIAQKKASEPAPQPQPQPEPPPRPEQSVPEPAAQPSAASTSTAGDVSATVGDDSKPAWYKDPVGGALTASGVVGLGLGLGFYVSGRSANSDAESTDSAAEFARLKDRAQSRGRIGYVGMVAGSALLAGGIVWYVLDPMGRDDDKSISAWVTSGSGGVALSGQF